MFVELMSIYDYEELCGRVHGIFDPEPTIGNEGEEWCETPPDSRLEVKYGLNTSYWKPFEYGSSSPLVRRALVQENDLAAIVGAQQVPRELLMGTLRLFGDSIIAYHGPSRRSGPYRFYPAILMSAWASFESFVRIYSQLLVKTAGDLPTPVEEALLEKEERIDTHGKTRVRRNPQPSLHRYWWLLKFGFGCQYDRGCRIWQMGQAAIEKRNELVHYKFSDMPSLKTTELWQHLEAILLLLIGPSSQIGRSVMPGQYEVYGILCELHDLVEEFEEKPFFKGIPLKLDSVLFPCGFENVDETKFPTMNQYFERTKTSEK